MSWCMQAKADGNLDICDNNGYSISDMQENLYAEQELPFGVEFWGPPLVGSLATWALNQASGSKMQELNRVAQ